MQRDSVPRGKGLRTYMGVCTLAYLHHTLRLGGVKSATAIAGIAQTLDWHRTAPRLVTAPHKTYHAGQSHEAYTPWPTEGLMGCCLFCVSSTDESSSFLQPFGPTVTWLPDSPSVGYSMGSQFFLIGSSFHPNSTSPDWVQGLHHMACHQLENGSWMAVVDGHHRLAPKAENR